MIKDVKVDSTTEVGLLIGADCPNALEPKEVIPSQNDGPYAVKTELGWCVIGPVEGEQKVKLKVNKIAVQQADNKELSKHHFEIKETLKETKVLQLLQKMYDVEFAEKAGSKSNSMESSAMSVEEKKIYEYCQSWYSL